MGAMAYLLILPLVHPGSIIRGKSASRGQSASQPRNGPRNLLVSPLKAKPGSRSEPNSPAMSPKTRDGLSVAEHRRQQERAAAAELLKVRREELAATKARKKEIDSQDKSKELHHIHTGAFKLASKEAVSPLSTPCGPTLYLVSRYDTPKLSRYDTSF